MTGMEPFLVGAAMGGATSMLTGGDPIKGALMGGLTGGITSAAGAGIQSLLGSGADAAMLGATAEGVAGGANAASALEGAAGGIPNVGAASANPLGLDFAAASDLAAPAGLSNVGAASANPFGLSFAGADSAVTPALEASGAAGATPATNGVDRFMDSPWESIKANSGAAFTGAMQGLPTPAGLPGKEKYTGPLSRYKFDPERYRSSRARGYAGGGIAALAGGGLPATARGYAVGGTLTQGPGDGMSDSIPASIAGQQPALLSDSEFVVPADVVAHLGNGSSDAGARQLYSMMDRVRQARTGSTTQAPQINAGRMMPA